MSKGYTISRIIFTVLLSFCIAGHILSSAADSMLSLPGIYTNIIRDEKLADKAYSAIEGDFKKQYNTTAIPTEVYMDAISTEWLEKEMCKRTEIYLDYINGTDTDYLTNFTALEESITTFFNEYAESIDYKQDEAFDKKLSETIANAKSTIEQRMDAFYMNTLRDNGYLDKLRKFTPIIGIINWCLFGVSMLLVVLLAFIERNRNWRNLYWAGTGFFCGGALTAIPCIYLLFTNAVSSFAVKDPIIFTAVTDLLDTGIWRVMIRSILYIALGVITITLNVIFSKKEQTEITDNSK